MNITKFAWRNIWRNRSRTVITIASVFFAVLFSVIMMGFSKGSWDRMIENMLKTQTGHIQIHGKEYWDDKVVDNFMFMDNATIKRLEKTGNVENVSPRVETFAMATTGTVTKGIALTGVSPEKEAQKSNLPSRIVSGGYLSETDDGILIGKGLADYLKVSVGDTLALIGQGYHGAGAAQLFPVRGIVKLMTAEMDNGVVYATLPASQQFIDMPEGYSGILISVKENRRLDETIKEVRTCLEQASPQQGSEYAVYPWHFTMERLLQQSQSDKAFSVILMFILYVIVGFGILGSVIMMTNERIREFCMIISLGMSRLKLAAVSVAEMLIKSLIGVVAAILVTLPVTYYYTVNPIKISGKMADMFLQYGMEPFLPMASQPSVFINPMLVILLIVLVTVIYPIRKIRNLDISKK